MFMYFIYFMNYYVGISGSKKVYNLKNLVKHFQIFF
jgi:hypothetical protein